MGTRHLICVVSDGDYKVAQYGQWDGYPSGQGAAILEFLHKEDLVSKLKENLKYCSWVSDAEIKRLWFTMDGDDDASAFYGKYPQLSRDAGSDVLYIIADSTCSVPLKDSRDFAYDSVWCEYAYVIDFDKNTFEVYTGFNERPLNPNDRFYTENLVEYNLDKQYYPVKLLQSFDLSDLPTEDVFIDLCESKIQEENEQENAF